MPITPFHFGPGVLFHSAAPPRVSFLAFVAANGITDVESIYNVLAGNFPDHRFLHTFVGAALVTALTVALFMATRRLARSVTLPNWFQWQKLPLAAVIVGAALGAFSHIVLDGIMHADMRPLAPWRTVLDWQLRWIHGEPGQKMGCFDTSRLLRPSGARLAGLI